MSFFPIFNKVHCFFKNIDIIIYNNFYVLLKYLNIINYIVPIKKFLELG